MVIFCGIKFQWNTHSKRIVMPYVNGRLPRFQNINLARWRSFPKVMKPRLRRSDGNTIRGSEILQDHVTTVKTYTQHYSQSNGVKLFCRRPWLLLYASSVRFRFYFFTRVFLPNLFNLTLSRPVNTTANINPSLTFDNNNTYSVPLLQWWLKPENIVLIGIQYNSIMIWHLYAVIV